ncbi:MAG: OPT family oligopeptide transporter [Pirellulales bacterium]
MAAESGAKPATPGAIAEDDYEREARDWLENVYQGDTVRQLSPRAIIGGMLIGGLMSISNVYIGLKTGWGLGVTITSSIIAYAVFRALETVSPRIRRDPLTILENYTMSSAASAAGYMSTSGLVSSIPALYMATGKELAWWEMMSWLAAISMLGVFMAIPLKRQLINIDKLPFPTGLATAETLRSIHTRGSAAMAKAYALLAGGVAGGAVAFLRGALHLIPDELPLVPGEGGRSLLRYTSFGFEGSLVMVAAGAIMGIRVGVSLLVGAIVYYGMIGPVLIERGITGEGYTGIVKWALWPASAMMVTSGLLAFALRWRTVLRSFAGLISIVIPQTTRDPLEHIEVPGKWFLFGTLVSGTACVILGHLLFDIRWWMGIVAVLLTFVLSIVAARATGETDITPISAMGQITQLVYGVVAPTNLTTNLMTASVTAGASAHSADLLTDLKSGYLLGGNARKQTISQLLGVVAGTLFTVPVYMLLVPDPAKLGETFAAPSAVVWSSVALMLAEGLQALPPGTFWAVIIGGVLGIALVLAEAWTPKKYHKFIPSAIGLGIAGIIPAFNSVAMFLGALAAWVLSKRRPDLDKGYTIPVSSGLIAGESLMAVSINLVAASSGIVDVIKQQL